jgi:hypothetical protein
VGCSTSAVTSSSRSAYSPSGALAAGLGDELLLDVGAALGEIGDHLALGQQRGLVGVGAGDVDVAAAHEAVAAGGAAGLDVEHAAGHDVAVEHRGLWAGRTKVASPSPQRITLGMGSALRASWTMPPSTRRASRRPPCWCGTGPRPCRHAALEAGHGGQGMPLASSLVRAAGWPSASRPRRPA